MWLLAYALALLALGYLIWFIYNIYLDYKMGYKSTDSTIEDEVSGD